MKISRPALALAAGASLVLSGAAVAAPAKTAPPVCNQVLDDKGDAGVITDQPSFDILSADVATDSKKLRAVIRLDATPSATNPEGGQTQRFYFEFLAPGSDNAQFVTASLSGGTGTLSFRTGEIVKSATGTTYTSDAANPDVTGTIADKTVTITAPLTAFTRVKLTKGAKVTGMTVTTKALIGVLLVPADDAAGAKPYVVGAPTCVKMA